MKTAAKITALCLLVLFVTDCTKKADAVLTVPTLATFTIPAKTYGDAAFDLTPPKSDSPGDISYLSTNAAVATIVGAKVTIVGVGSCLIMAKQAASGIFAAANTYATLLVNGQAPTISAFTMPTDKYVGDAFTITLPTSNNPAAFAFNSSNPAVATLSGINVLTVRGVGQSTITAYQSFYGNFAAGQVVATLTVVR